MIRIRLRRVGAKKQPSYRIVVADSRSPRDGRFIEKIGFYNPRTEPATMEIDEARALYWLSQGAQPSDPVRHILDRIGTLGRYERLRAGETVDALADEAAAQAEVRGEVDPRTRRDDLTEARVLAKAKSRAEAEIEATKAETARVKKARVAAEAVVEGEVEAAEAEAEVEAEAAEAEAEVEGEIEVAEAEQEAESIEAEVAETERDAGEDEPAAETPEAETEAD